MHRWSHEIVLTKSKFHCPGDAKGVRSYRMEVSLQSISRIRLKSHLGPILDIVSAQGAWESIQNTHLFARPCFCHLRPYEVRVLIIVPPLY